MSCLQFLEEMLERLPCATAREVVPSTFSSNLHRQALAQVDFDRQQYQRGPAARKTFQLLLPSSVSASGAERLMIVDAAATSENEPTAVLKTMLRTDRENVLDGPGVRRVGALPA